MFPLTALTTAITASMILSNWRKALPLLFLIGVLQDVFRKLTPGTPAVYIVWIGAMFALVALVAYTRGAMYGLRPLYLHDSSLRTAWGLFISIVVLQALHTLARGGGLAMSVLGLAFYLGPVVGLLIGFAYARSEAWILRLLTGYVMIMAPAALTVYLAAEFGNQWPVLRDVGAMTGTHVLISGFGQPLESYSGLFRVGELAAWHAATSIAFLTILVMRRPRLVWIIGAGLLAALLVGAIILTGRRKMLMALAIFFAFQWVLLVVLRQGLIRRNKILLVIAISGVMGFGLLGHEDDGTVRSYYVERGESVFISTDDRLAMTLGLVEWAWRTSGILGKGAGVAGQGARYAGERPEDVNVGATEVGLGLILVELGLPGLLVILWLTLLLVRRLWWGLWILAGVNPSLPTYAVSFLALLVANAATFGTATQLYSDYVVLITLGLIAGMLFAVVYAGIEDYRLHFAWQARYYGACSASPDAYPTTAGEGALGSNGGDRR